MRRRRATAGVAAVLLLSLSACGGDSDKQAGSPSATASDRTAAETGSSSPSASASASASSSAVAAAGIELTEATSALNAPEGWTASDGLVDYASAAAGPGHYDSLLLADSVSLAGPDATYDSLAQSWFKVAPQGAKAKRLADVDLAGTPAYCIFYTVKGDPSLNYDIGTVRNGRAIDISFVLDKKTMDEDPHLVDSVVASFRWLQ